MIQIIPSYQFSKRFLTLEYIYEESQLNTDNSLSNNDSVFKLISNWTLIIERERKREKEMNFYFCKLIFWIIIDRLR